MSALQRSLINICIICLLATISFAKIIPVVQRTPSTPISLAVNNKILCIANIDDNTILIYEKKTNNLIKTLYLSFRPTSVDIIDNFLYIGSYGEGIFKLNLSNIDGKINKLPLKLDSKDEIIIKTYKIKNNLIFLSAQKDQKKHYYKYFYLYDLKHKIYDSKQSKGIYINKHDKIITYNSSQINNFLTKSNLFLIEKVRNGNILILKNNLTNNLITIEMADNNPMFFGYSFSYFKSNHKDNEDDIKQLYSNIEPIYTKKYKNILYLITKKFSVFKIDMKNNKKYLILSSRNISKSIQKLRKIKYINNDKYSFSRGGTFFNPYMEFAEYKDKNNQNIKIHNGYKKNTIDIDISNSKIFTINNVNLQNVVFCRLSDKHNYVILATLDKKMKNEKLELINLKNNRILTSINFTYKNLILSAIYIEDNNSLFYTSIGKLYKLNLNSKKLHSTNVNGINVVLYHKNRISLHNLSYDNYYIQLFNKKLQNIIYEIGFMNKKRLRVKTFKNNIVDISRTCAIGSIGKISTKEFNSIRKKYCTSINILANGYFDGTGNFKKKIHIVDTKKLKTYPLDKFYDKFYRPDLVKKVLSGEQLIQLDSIKNVLYNKAAPKIKIIRVSNYLTKNEKIKQTSKQYVYITLKITPKNDKIGNIIVKNNGVLVKDSNLRALHLKKKYYRLQPIYRKYKIYLLKGKNNISVYVTNKDNSMRSDIVKYKILAKLKRNKNKNLYAIIIGINKFSDNSYNLKNTVRDAKSFANLLSNVAKNYYNEVHIQLLTTKQETSKKNIINVMKKLSKIKDPNGTFIFYGATHGYVDELSGKYYFITSDFDGNMDSLSLDKKTINKDTLINNLGNIKMQNKLIILDTCYSAAGGEDMIEDLVKPSLEKISKSGISIYAGSGTFEEALDGYKGHGLFTYTLLKGMNVVQNKYRKITVSALGSYIENETPILAEKVNFVQDPLFEKQGANFIIGK